MSQITIDTHDVNCNNCAICIGRHIGETDERERIIKLLEKRFAENVDHCEWGTHLFLDNAIELIKGENK